MGQVPRSTLALRTRTRTWSTRVVTDDLGHGVVSMAGKFVEGVAHVLECLPGIEIASGSLELVRRCVRR